MVKHSQTDRLDAEESAARAERMHRSLPSVVRSQGVELYQRTALTRRVGDDGAGGSITTRHGHDEGLALRTAGRFVAGSGSDLPGLLRALERSIEAPDPGAGQPWFAGGEEARSDHDGMPELPSDGELGRSQADQARR